MIVYFPCRITKSSLKNLNLFFNYLKIRIQASLDKDIPISSTLGFATINQIIF